MLIHCLFYVPTISITNSIAFANLRDPQNDFGPVRLWGTIGWVAVSWPFVFILLDWTAVPEFGEVGPVEWFGKVAGGRQARRRTAARRSLDFIVAGVASLVLAAFSLTLPHTPPKPAVKGQESFAWLEAMKLLRVPYLLVLFAITFVDATVHTCYFIFTNDFLKSVGIPANWVMPVMSLGQIAEIGTMAMLGLVLKRLGWRTTMVIGILGHAVRFAVFALVPVPTVDVLVILLHGICYAFFFATVYIFVDEFFPKDARTSAQGLFNFLILGLGPFVGNFVWPMLGQYYKVGDLYQFRSIFLWPSAIALAAAVVLALFSVRLARHRRKPLPPIDDCPFFGKLGAGATKAPVARFSLLGPHRSVPTRRSRCNGKSFRHLALFT